jgi:hypothetical protein
MTVDGTATHKVDYTARSGSPKLRNGQLSTRIEIPIKYNPNFGGPVTFTVMLIDPITGQLLAMGTGTITPS